jgi:cytochrome c peroxidase
LLVTHAGTHELSIIDFSALLAKLATAERQVRPGEPPPEPAANDLAFLEGLRRRLNLSVKGPRSLAITEDSAYVAGYFSDNLDTVRLSASPATAGSIPLVAAARWSPLRQGEMNFNDASLCFEGWQSCATCHSDDARVDGLNWDLLNDGIGNPKNTKSLLFSHRTPPAMSTGVRETAETAVRAGIQHILFAVPTEAVAAPMDQWLQSLQPMAGPRLVASKFSPAALRGRKLFTNPRVGCATCHPPGLFTDLATYDVGTAGPADANVRAFDTPTLVELWRTAPYLHDGSATTLRDVLTTRNAVQQHGRTAHLSAGELDDLIEYLLSL